MAELRSVLEIVKEAGRMGLNFQRRIQFHGREFKDDGWVVTEAGRLIEDFLCEKIGALFADCNFVTEERFRDFTDGKELTFVIDPIDGTDSFSNGMHNWSISVGVLDKNLVPIGGIVYAPRLDFLVFADIGKLAMLGNEQLAVPAPVTELTKLSGVVMSSRIHLQLDLSAYPGKPNAGCC